MALCSNCGTQYEDGVQFCPSCGTAAQRSRAFSPVMPGTPSQDELQDAQENKAMAVLAYIFFFIPLLAAKESKFARYHTNQGLLIFLAAAVWGIAYGVLTTLLYVISFGLGLVLSGILGLTGLVFPILCIVGIINAVNGRMKPLPLLGKYTIIKS